MPPTRVLVVDDSAVARRMVCDALATDASIAVAGTASNGRLALAKLPQLNPDVVTLDVEMPGIDGFTVVERLRADPALRNIPAILVTSRAAPEDRQRGRDVGAQGYIVKSEFDQAELLTMIGPMVS